MGSTLAVLSLLLRGHLSDEFNINLTFVLYCVAGVCEVEVCTHAYLAMISDLYPPKVSLDSTGGDDSCVLDVRHHFDVRSGVLVCIV